MFKRKTSFQDKRRTVVMAQFLHNSPRNIFTFHDYTARYPYDSVPRRNAILKAAIKRAKKKYGGYYEYRCDEYDCIIVKYDKKRSKHTYCKSCHTKLGLFNSVDEGISETTGSELRCKKCNAVTDTGPALPSTWRTC